MPAATIVDVLREHAERRPAATSFLFLSNGQVEQERVGFHELERRAAAVAAELQQRRLAGERVVLMFQPGLEFICAFFGCLAARVIAVPVYPPRRAQECKHVLQIARAAGARRVLTDTATAELLARLGETSSGLPPLEAVTWLAEPTEVEGRAQAARREQLDPDGIAFLQFTSGSTGAPKGVIVTHANIVANQRAICDGFGHGEDTTVLGWLPFYHDMGLVGVVMQPVFLGRPCVLMPPAAFIQKPVRWLEAISRYRATTSGGPNFAYQLCVDAIAEADLERCAGLDLSGWRLAFVGSEPVRAVTLDRFAEKFKAVGFDRRAFYPCYGLAEATLMLTGPERPRACASVRLDADALAEGRTVQAGSDRVVEVVSCGQPWGSEEILIVDPDTGLPVPEGRVGEIWATGPSIAQGYWADPVASAVYFAARSPACPNKPFLRTGDLGFVRDGELYVTGRLKSLLIIHGRNYYPHDIESTVSTLHRAFRPLAAVFADDDIGPTQIVLVQEVYKHLAKQLEVTDIQKLIRRKVFAAHGINLGEIVLTTSRIPVTTSGKVRRGVCRDAWRSGLLTPVGKQAAAGGRGSDEFYGQGEA